MAANASSKFPSLTDLQKMLDPKGRMAKSVDFLTQANELLQVMSWMPCNDGIQHLVTQEVALPDVYTMQVNKGVVPSDGRDDNFYEPTAMFKSIQEIDAEAAELTGNPAQIMAQKARKHREAHAQNFVYNFFYGNALTDPDSFPGMSYRYSSLSGVNAQNVIDAGGSGGGCASMWLMGFGDDAVSGLYPEGTMAGLETIDKGKVDKDNAGGVQDAVQEVYRAHFKWRAGAMLANWQWAVRVPNIKVSALLAETDEADLIQFAEDAIHCLPSTNVMMNRGSGNGRPMGWFMNRTLRKFINRQSRKQVAQGGGLDWATVDGVRRRTLHGIPMYTCDQLLNTEDTVS